MEYQPQIAHEIEDKIKVKKNKKEIRKIEKYEIRPTAFVILIAKEDTALLTSTVL